MYNKLIRLRSLMSLKRSLQNSYHCVVAPEDSAPAQHFRAIAVSLLVRYRWQSVEVCLKFIIQLQALLYATPVLDNPFLAHRKE